MLQQGGAASLIEAEFPGSDTEAAIAEARRIFGAPELVHLFEEEVLSEVSLTADLPLLGRLTGIIDKLIVSNSKITAIDFKTNAVVPTSVEQVPDGLLRQMGAYLAMLESIYPDRAVEVSILWTANANLMPLPHDIVRQALQEAATS